MGKDLAAGTTSPDEISFLEGADPRSIRDAVRAGRYNGMTAPLAPGFVQGSVCILPKEWAGEFLLFCQRNRKALPVLAISEPGEPRLPALAEDLDPRTDVPEYRVFRGGDAAEERTDIRDLWRDDLVGFVLGSSFSVDQALRDAGVRLKHVARHAGAALYRTNIECMRAGRFRGRLVVLMRALRPRDAIRAIEITSRYPALHGAPVYIDKPGLIGVDLDQPYLGEGASDVADNELAVFWASSATIQSVIETVKPPLCITNVPGKMLLTDKRTALFALS